MADNDERGAAWSELIDATPPGWFVGRPSLCLHLGALELRPQVEPDNQVHYRASG